MELNKEYQDKVYAGVLGKIIGVYLGRPFEQWTHELIMERLGPINYYVNEKMGVPLIVPDDDITGTFCFLRALSDYDDGFDITPEQIGQTWLNNIVERETILWWGGVGNSTEHTAFINLKNGIPAPRSGSSALNGTVMAEQIGSQIFIDGWAMVCPGDPEKAADLARRAASVSHDGEAIYGAQVIAALEAQAFIDNDTQSLLEVGKSLIPNDSTIYRLINDIQDWHWGEPDWMKTREKIVQQYGYDSYPGHCHMVPNHALIIMSLLYGDDDFQKSMMIVNTAGWDTDCNAGNLGCILGIKNGLQTFDGGPDWRSPVSDLMYCPTANGGETITDAVRESYKIINIARKAQGDSPVVPKNGARYHFEMPGSVQGWQVSPHQQGANTTRICNVDGHSSSGDRSLEISFSELSKQSTSKVFVNTFFPEDVKNLTGEARAAFFGYNFLSCPVAYSGQTVTASVQADGNNDGPVACNLFACVYGENDQLVTIESNRMVLEPNTQVSIDWLLEIPDGSPVVQLGLEIHADEATSGKVYLDYLDVAGDPKVTFERPSHVPVFERGKVPDAPPAEMWKSSWVKATDHWSSRWAETFRISNDQGKGMIITGTSDWQDYTVKSKITFDLAESGGVGARVQGLERYYALELTRGNKVRLIKKLDGTHILQEVDFAFEFNREYEFSLNVQGNFLIGAIDGVELISFEDRTSPLQSGGISLLVESGTLSTNRIEVC